MPIGSHEEPARRRGRLTQLFLGVTHENLLPSRPRPLHNVLRDSSGAARLLSGTSYPLGVPRHPPNLVIMCRSEIHLFFSGANLEGFNFQCKIGQVRYFAKLKNNELQGMKSPLRWSEMAVIGASVGVDSAGLAQGIVWRGVQGLRTDPGEGLGLGRAWDIRFGSVPSEAPRGRQASRDGL